MESEEKNPHRIVLSPDDFNDLMKNNERCIAIIGAAKIDVYLGMMLSAAMVKDRKFVESLLDNATLAVKIKTAYAFKLIDKKTRSDLDCIRNIRNEFAHSMDKEMSFQHDDVRKHCDKLSTTKREKGKVHRPTDLFNQAIQENIHRIHIKTLTQFSALMKAFRDSHS